MTHPTLARTAALLVVLCGTTAAIAAGPVYWDWPADRPFAETTLDGAALGPDGNLRGGLGMRDLGPDGPEVFWRVVPDGRGGYLVGSGHGGEIHRVDLDGGAELVATLEGTEVFSLQARDDGSLLAGCGPEGGFYLVAASGEVTPLGSVAGGYVWDIEIRPGDPSEVWLAAGSPAAVYRYRAREDQLEEILSLPAQNALDIHFDGAGDLWVAAQGPGLVYRLDPDRPDALDLVFETEQDEARQFIAGPEGDLFLLALEPEDLGLEAGGNGGGNGRNGPPPALLALLDQVDGPAIDRAALYRLAPDGGVTTHWSGPLDLMIAAWSPARGWLAAGPLTADGDRAVLHALTPPAGAHPVASWPGGDVLDLHVDPAGAVLAAQAHPGTLALLGEDASDRREAVSPPLDAGRPVRWGRLAWSGDGFDRDPRWSVRGGNRALPDDSWTDWSAEWTGDDQAIDLQPCRYLQWRVRFPGAGSAGRVTAVTVSAWRDNLPPVIDHFAEERLQQMNFGPMGGRSDNVTQTFRSGLQAEFSQGSVEDRLVAPDRVAVGRTVRIFTWAGSDPDGDRVTFDLEFRARGAAAWRPIVTGSPEMLGSWDTSTVTDGSYDLRLTARDGRDNPAHLAAASSRQLGPVTVDNTPPEVKDATFAPEEGGLRIRLEAADRASALAWAVVELPDGSRERLDPVDGICDSRREKWDAVVAWPRDGRTAGPRPWTFAVEVGDLGGNTRRTEGEWK
jgi:hypothetical protein